MGMLERNARFRTSAIAMHWSAHELRCSTNFMSMSPANNVNLTARSSARVQPFPLQPVVIASLQTAATFSRNDFCLIFIKLGKSFAISLTPYFVGSVVVGIMMTLGGTRSPSALKIELGELDPPLIATCLFQV